MVVVLPQVPVLVTENTIVKRVLLSKPVATHEFQGIDDKLRCNLHAPLTHKIDELGGRQMFFSL